jgi:hypothetical protein
VKHASKLRSKRDGLNKPGFVYLIECHEYVKVGYADNVAVRLSQLQTGCPYELRLLKAFPVDNMETAERKMHELWKRYEVRGEWFNVPAGELAFALSSDCLDDVSA